MTQEQTLKSIEAILHLASERGLREHQLALQEAASQSQYAWSAAT